LHRGSADPDRRSARWGLAIAQDTGNRYNESEVAMTLARQEAKHGDDNCAKSEVVAQGIDTINGVAETSYASCGDLSLAYQVFGDGPVELVFAGSFVSHVELFWTLPEFQARPRSRPSWTPSASEGRPYSV
jgi:hypothetical protein